MRDSNKLSHYWWTGLVIISLLAAGCASVTPQQDSQAQATPPAASSTPPPAGSTPPPLASLPKTDIWPKIYDDDTYLTMFDSNWTEAEAVGTIKNLQNSFVEFNAGIPLSELDVDPYGLRAKWQWSEDNFVKSASLIIPFDQVSSILLEHYPKLDKNYKWGIIVHMTGSNKAMLLTPTRDAAERLGKAILVLAKARKAPLSMPNPRFGAALAPLTEAQAQAAGILKTSGVIVHWVFKESPAEKASISPQDIITTVGGKAVHTAGEVFALIDAAAAAGATHINIDGIRRSYKIEDGKYIEIFVPLTYTLPIEQVGGAE